MRFKWNHVGKVLVQNLGRNEKLTEGRVCAQLLSCVQLSVTPRLLCPGISQAGILEWVAISYSRDWACLSCTSCIGGWILCHCATCEACHQWRGCGCVCLVTQSCLTLCDPMDCSPPSSFVRGDSPGKNTRVGCHAFLQGIFPTQGSNPPGLPHCRWILHCLSHHGNLCYLSCYLSHYLEILLFFFLVIVVVCAIRFILSRYFKLLSCYFHCNYTGKELIIPNWIFSFSLVHFICFFLFLRWNCLNRKIMAGTLEAEYRKDMFV